MKRGTNSQRNRRAGRGRGARKSRREKWVEEEGIAVEAGGWGQKDGGRPGRNVVSCLCRGKVGVFPPHHGHRLLSCPDRRTLWAADLTCRPVFETPQRPCWHLSSPGRAGPCPVPPLLFWRSLPGAWASPSSWGPLSLAMPTLSPSTWWESFALAGASLVLGKEGGSQGQDGGACPRPWFLHTDGGWDAPQPVGAILDVLVRPQDLGSPEHA